MPILDNNLITLFSLDLFRQIAESKQVSILKYNAFTSMLIYHNISFDVTFSERTRRAASTIQLTIYISPVMNVVLSINLENGMNNNNFDSTSIAH